MFRISKTEISDIGLITDDLLLDFIKKHKRNCADRYQKLYNAYTSDHEILHAPKKPKYKPDNRIVVNFPKYIVDTMNGFFIGNPIKVIAADEKTAEFVEHIDRYNDQDDNNAELSKICDIYGKAYEVYFTDEASELCITYLSPLEAFMIFDDSIIEKPLFFVRLWTDRNSNEYGTMYTETQKRDFKVNSAIEWLGEEWVEHFFPGVPATEYVENGERQGIFEPILSISNAYNKAISEKANDVDYFADAYLKVLGVKVEGEDVEFIRDNRIVNFFGDDAEKIIAEFMGKPESDTAQENHLNRLERLIYQISMVANISDENFGTASGIALKYKLQAMSNLAKTKERKFASGMNRRYKLLFGSPLSPVPADAWMTLDYKFTMNFPANLLEEAQIAAQMEGITSHETQLKVLSIVDNVQDELDKIKEENKPDEESIVDRLTFGSHTHDETEEAETEDAVNGINI